MIVSDLFCKFAPDMKPALARGLYIIKVKSGAGMKIKK